tara:strand:- start:633 stop:857 length:225 start_codon:yes stop_codon:yes gene_type:complete
MNYIPVEGYPGLFRDTTTNAIINMNKQMTTQGMSAHQLAKQRVQDVEDLKQDVAELKDLVKQLINREITNDGNS